MTPTTERYAVEWLITPQLWLFPAVQLMTGLVDLARDGIVELTFGACPPPVPSAGSVIRWVVHDRNSQATWQVALDFADSADYFDDRSLAECDVYFKRCFFSSAVKARQADSKARIDPLGLWFPCLSDSARLPLASFAMRRFFANVRRSLRFGAAARTLIDDLRLVRGVPDAASFEAPSLDQRRPVVVFQTRVWEPEPSADDLPALNEQRAQLVRVLRERLGPRFVGGIVPDEYSRRIYPALLAAQDTRRRDYAQLLSTASIGVYSRGIHGSIACKLAEYLAAGLAIVTEPISHDLGPPLTDRTHYLDYRSPDECADACEDLLSDARALRAMQANNQNYYQRFVEPREHTARLIRGAFGMKPSSY